MINKTSKRLLDSKITVDNDIKSNAIKIAKDCSGCLNFSGSFDMRIKNPKTKLILWQYANSASIITLLCQENWN